GDSNAARFQTPCTMKYQTPKTLLVACLAALLVVPSVRAAEATEQAVLDAVQAWCDALLKISKTHQEGGDAKAVAEEVLTRAYNYDKGKTLFKPTLAFGDDTFRLTKEGALAYFVGGNPNFPDDSGFALKGWTEAKFTTAGTICDGNIGIYMGNVSLKNNKGEWTTVDKTFVFDFADDGNPRIIVHKSALPFSPE
ncbi:MAG: hypothetical protein SNJ52_03485, partial [Verrucomicrobiia bacterium]